MGAVNSISSWSHKLTSAKVGSKFGLFNGTSTVNPSYIDHIFLQQDTAFCVTSIWSLMNPLQTLIMDHNPSWVKIDWLETPPYAQVNEP